MYHHSDINNEILKEFFSKKVSKVEALRIPFAQDKAPEEQVFDQILAILKNTSASTPIVFNCQVRKFSVQIPNRSIVNINRINGNLISRLVSAEQPLPW